MTAQSKPDAGLKSFKLFWTTDAAAGFMVFLLAMPLSLGIAKACEFPAIYGLVTAIIGGIVVSFFSGSELTVKGPAAGLIVIAAGAVTEFGGGEAGWHAALACIVVSGIVQIIFSFLKFGKLADAIPGAAIHGMLAAIGIIIMSKQIHNLLGIPPVWLKGKEPLELIAMIPESLKHENAHLTKIGIACLVILGIFSMIKNKFVKKIPAPLIVLIVAIPLGYLLRVNTQIAIQNIFLHQSENFANVKVGSIIDEFKKSVINVDFKSALEMPGVFFKYIVLFSLIGSIESLLAVKAIDGMDSYKRKSNADKDLMGVGIGNIICGIIGGLPMISEIARSSANIDNGAKTRWGNFFHGLFLLLALLFGVSIIEMIPNTALAAMLIFVGYKLAHPKEFIHMWHIGKEQFVVFASTVVITVSTDLLIGVSSGIILEMLIYLAGGISFGSLFKSDIETKKTEGVYTVSVRGGAAFPNLIKLKNIIAAIPRENNIILDLSNAKLIDHTTISALNQIRRDFKNEGREFSITGLDNHIAMSKHPLAGRKLKACFVY